MKRTHLLFAAAALLLLTACNTTLQTKIIHPEKMWTFHRGATDEADFSCFPFTCGLHGFGSGGELTPGRVTVGFASVFDEGTLPCNCWRWVSVADRGAVRFNTDELPKNFVSAQLVIKPDVVDRWDGDTASNDESGTIAAIFLPTNQWYLGVLTTIFPDEHGTETALLNVHAFHPETVPWIAAFPENPGPSFPAQGFPVRKNGGVYRIEASNQFRSWQKGTEPNRGFMLVGRNESLPGKTHQARSATYRVWLEVVFNPNNQ